MKKGLLAISMVLFVMQVFAQHPAIRWNLVWSDEFNYSGLPDSTRWNYDTRGNEYGWGNNEKQWYNVANIKNTEVSEGTLKIRAYKEPAGNKNYSSGRINTQYKGDWKYGKVEVRAKLPKGNGTWPAIWMLSTDNSYGGWPHSGEIDIMEHVGFNPDSVFSTAHTGKFNHVKKTQVGKKTFLPTATSDFHTYTLEWDENGYKSFVDGKHFFTFSKMDGGPEAWPFDQRFYLILNLAIGGGLGGKKGIDDNLFPHTMEVDYVRIYKADTVAVSELIKNRQVLDTNLVLPPSWAFGMLYGGYTNQEGTVQRVSDIIKRDLPIDAYWIDSWFWDHANKGRGPEKYIDFVADTVGYPNRKAMWDFLQKNGVKGGFWIWDCIQQTGNEEAFEAFKSRNYFKDIYMNTSSWHNKSTTTAMYESGKDKVGTPTGNIDFKNPSAVAFFKEKIKPFFEEGADFLKLDRTSSIPVCKAMFEMTQEFGKETKGRGFILSHTGGMEDETYKKYPAKWTDDTRSDWTIETPLIQFNSWVPRVALKENIAMYTDPLKSSSQIPFLTNDLGGFDMGKTDKPEDELYIRWLQFAMFGSITEAFSQPENPTANMPWNYGMNAENIFRDYAKWRMQLFPYIYSNAHLSRIAGRHILGKIPGRLYEFTLGENMLIAPVYEKGATTREVFLPEGTWTNHWTGEQLKGNRTYIVQAPLQQIPVFYKQGAIVPMRAYAPSVEKGTNDNLTVHYYPTADGEFHLIEDDGKGNDYLKGIYASTKLTMKVEDKSVLLGVEPVFGKFEGMSSKRSWKFMVHQSERPLSVILNGKKVDFEYNEFQKIITISQTAVQKKKGLNVEINY